MAMLAVFTLMTFVMTVFLINDKAPTLKSFWDALFLRYVSKSFSVFSVFLVFLTTSIIIHFYERLVAYLIYFLLHFDEIVGKILTKDKKSKIFFIKDKREIMSKKLLKRFEKNTLIDLNRVTFFEKMGVEDYINTCGSSSVLLDTLYFGAGNSFHESMFYGTPTVTMPTENLKSRIVLGAYKQMQIEKPPIVTSIDEYVDCAVELANLENNKMLELKKYFQKRANDYLFENKEFIKNINSILENLHQI